MRGRVGFLLLLCSAVVFAACGGGGEKDRVALPFTEDFSDCQPVVDEEVTIKCVDGQASVLIKRTDVRIGQMLPIDLPRTMSSVALGVDATLAAAPGRASKQFVATGVACWISPPDEKTRGYAFIVSPRTHVYGILRVDETDPSLNKLNNAYPLIFRPSSTVRGQGSVNHIRGECREDAGQIALKMFVNGVEIGDASDSHFHGFQQAAIVAYSTEPGTEFRYDNFVADVPD